MRNSIADWLALTRKFLVAACGLGLALPALAVNTVHPDTGAWWNPAESGRGFFIESHGDTVVLSGFLYDGVGNPLWFISSGTLAGNSVSGPMLTYGFGPLGHTLGTITLQFTSSNAAMLTWPGGTEPISRFGLGPGGSVLAPTVFGPQAGVWWSPADGGQGYTVEVQGDTLLLGAYTYDAMGFPVWSIASGQVTQSHGLDTYDVEFSGAWQRYANGQAMGAPYRMPQLANSDMAAASYTGVVPNPGFLRVKVPDGRTIQLQKFTF